MRQTFNTLLLAGLIAFGFSGCKKGDSDPAISLRTRKARLVGEWRLASGAVSFTGSNYARKYEFDGSNYKQFDTYTGGYPVVYTGKYLLNLNIKKDGTFSVSESAGSRSMVASGTWKFNSGVGKAKAKEAVIFQITEIQSGNASEQVFNKYATTFCYQLKGLKNKELQIESFELLESDSGQNEVTENAFYKFIQ